MAEPVRVENRSGITEIVISRPEKKNALTGAMYQAMAEAILAAQSQAEIRMVLIRGDGDAFTAGNDLGDFLANPPDSADSPVFRFMRALSAAEKPVLAAVHGSAVGIGTTMLLHCDLVLAADSARFSLPFTRLALVPEFASSQLLPQLAGHRRAFELLVLGEPFDAETALSFGLVNKLVPEAGLKDAAFALAAALAALPPAAVKAAKALLKTAPEAMEARIDREARQFKERLASPEFREAATAFLEKRPPDFSRF